MSDMLERTEMLIGADAVKILKKSTVALFGIGGVGGYTLEALVRAGVGSFILIDNDTVSESNLNRQIIATLDTVGKLKTEAARERALSINPEADIRIYNTFVLPENIESIDLSGCDYIVDAVDTVTAKIAIIERAKALGIPVISSMGTGNKLDPTAFEVADIYKTSVCPLARVMRYELKKRGIKKLKVVYSREEPRKPKPTAEGSKPTPASISFVPSVAGLIIGGEVVKDLVSMHNA